jgi:hypothetical protein
MTVTAPALAALLAAAAGAPGAAAADTLLVCSAERLAVASGDSVAARAWLADTAGVRVEWSASAGHARGEGARAVWRLDGAPLGTATLTARVTAGGAAQRACTIRVAVLAPGPGRGSTLAGRALLRPDSVEAAGFGLYSYLIFTAPPSAAGRERQRRVAEAYLRLAADAAELAKYQDRAGVNVTYAPVARVPLRLSADSLLASYHHARAQALLARAGRPRGGGEIFLVSARTPLSAGGARGPVLVENLSSVPPEVAVLWVAEFFNQTSQERFTEPDALRRVGLRMRTALAIAGQALPESRHALDGWIEWISDKEEP